MSLLRKKMEYKKRIDFFIGLLKYVKDLDQKFVKVFQKFLQT
jgi:hypothetical protein